MSLRAHLLWLPPPVITGFTALMMWLSSVWLADTWLADQPWHFLNLGWLAIGVGGMGVLLMVFAAQTLHRAKTTLLPFAPERATVLVSQGLFKYSRNPIYVGDAFLLLAWTIWLGYAINLLWLALFVLYMSKVQIAAEERALQKKFGTAYQQYCQRVRRWL